MIPNIVHFNYGLMPQNEDFLFTYYIAVLSCKLINNPDKIYFHYHYEPKGYWWDKTKVLVDLIKIDVPTHIGNKPIKKVAHKSDIARMMALKKYGGVYLDIDTICIRSYKDLLHNKFVIANEITESGKNMGLCNAIMMSEPESSFINDWWNNYENFFNPDGWQEASTMLPLKVSELNQNLTILKPSNFLLPSWESTDMIFEKENNIHEDLIVLHYWNQYSINKYLNQIKNFDWILDNSHTLYGKALINLISKIPLTKYKSYDITCKNIFDNINITDFNKLNYTNFQSINEITNMYNKSTNLIVSSKFKNDLQIIGESSVRVFNKNFNLQQPLNIIANTNNLNCTVDVNNDNKYIKLTMTNIQNNTIINISQDLNQTVIFNVILNPTIYIFPENYNINKPIKNISITPVINIPNMKFTINTDYINDNLAYVNIKHNILDRGWDENLYLDVQVNNKNFYFYVGKSFEPEINIVLHITEKLEYNDNNIQLRKPAFEFQKYFKE